MKLRNMPSGLHWRAQRMLSVVYVAPLIFLFVLERGLLLTLTVPILDQDHALT